MLDNILEESVDQHFHSLIQTRHMQRRRDVIDDSLPAEVIEEMGDNLWEPPEVRNHVVKYYFDGATILVARHLQDFKMI